MIVRYNGLIIVNFMRNGVKYHQNLENIIFIIWIRILPPTKKKLKIAIIERKQRPTSRFRNLK